jgi:Flp pilus assembly protein TadG
MKRRLSAFWRDEKGSATALVAVSLTALVSIMALGIDIGMLFNARSEAQRAADAAALAGASAFLDFPADEAAKPATQRAIDYAVQNNIRREAILPSEVSVLVNRDSATVTVTVRRAEVPTWFARVLSVSEVAIGATATAQASDAGTAQCLKPFAVPDAWEETTEDRNRNRIQDPGEIWSFDPNQDRYSPYTGPDGDPAETGFGGEWRNPFPDLEGRRYDRDYGRRITIKVTDPHATLVPSFFYPWVLPVDAGQPDCGEDRDVTDPGDGNNGNGNNGNKGNGNNGNNGNGNNGNNGNGNNGNNGNGNNGNNGNGNNGNNGNGNNGNNGNGNNGNKGNGNNGNNGNGGNGGNGGGTGGSGKGGAAYRRNICSCNASVIDLESEYLIEPGNMVGPTFQGVEALIAQDPDAYWDEGDNRIVSDFGESSPRLITVALFDPSEIQKGGRQLIRFNNFARFFIEGQESPQDPVVGRFLFYVAGAGPGTTRGTRTGSLVKQLRLIR